MPGTSTWGPNTGPMTFPSLRGSLEVDVAIVGGGIVGVIAAYELTRAGKKVALIEKHHISGNASGWTTGFITYVTDAHLAELRRTFGAERAALAWKSGRRAIDEIEQIVRREAIDCEFMRVPAYVYAADEAGLALLRREAAIAHEAGIELREGREKLGFETPGYLRVDDQAKFHPIKFLTALALRAKALGAEVFEDTQVLERTGAGPYVLKTKDGEVRANRLVLATGRPMSDPDAVSFRTIASHTYVIEAKIPSGILPEGLYWDTARPYVYFRVDKLPTHDRLILGGEDRMNGINDDPQARYQALERRIRKLAPDAEIVRRWAGELIDTIDRLPFIGATVSDRSVFMATGFAGNGMTFGALAGMLIRDLILGKTSAETKLYRTLRFTGLGRLMVRGNNYMMRFFTGRFRKPTTTIKDLPPDEGAVVDIGGKKVAAYKTKDGKLITCSAVCTHLGCIVGWNGAEKTWDCPCHGSRYHTDGSVANGPAKRPLKKID